jgi:hypothetical protein
VKPRKSPRPEITVVASFFHPTADDWYPNFPRDTVRVRLTRFPGGMLRMTVAGADDTYMEKEVTHIPAADLDARCVECKRWLENDLPNPLTRAWLRRQGFTNG